MSRTGAVVRCRLCGEERLFQVIITKRHVAEDGEPRVDVEVADRDAPMVERFFKIHQLPVAMAVT